MVEKQPDRMIASPVKIVSREKEDEMVLRIPAKKYTAETTVISVRLPKDMLEDIDSLAKSSGRTRNELMTAALEFSLKHIEIVIQEA